MPEDAWTDLYASDGVHRLDCCRFIWPKLSFIRKCVSLTGYVKEGASSDERIVEPSSLHGVGSKLSRRHSAPIGSYESPTRKKLKKEVLKNFEKVRNSHEKPIKRPSEWKKRNREAVYSDDEAVGMSSDEEDACGNSLYFRV